MASDDSSPFYGVYTKTVVRSPVIQCILHAQIRSRRCNDVVFVGNDFIHVKQVGKEGHLQPVASKNDFDARIRAAAVFNNEDPSQDIDFLVKLENERSDSDNAGFPPQTLVITLDSNQVVFIYLQTAGNGSFCFIQQLLPMPSWNRKLYQPGEYLAVDPYSRALAVAADERNLILYAPKPKDQIQSEMKSRSPSWCPISGQRALSIDGVIHQMNFLMPPANDDDHIILLLIVTDQRRTKAVRVDWYYSSGVQEAQIYPGQSLDSAVQVPNLLVPLLDSSFLLAIGSEVTRWKNILTGSVSGTSVAITPKLDPRYPGVSAHAPAWAGWTRPRRNKGSKRLRDDIYLAREDGCIFWMQMSATGSIHSVSAGELNCHVGSAFTSLDEEDGPDILAVGGEQSGGVVISIGQWPSFRPLEELSRLDTMEPEVIEIMPNWASATDMIGINHSRSPRSDMCHAEEVLVTSGCQPFGGLTEIRHGCELLLSVLIPWNGLRNVTNIWTLPNPSDGSILIVLSEPQLTRLVIFPAEFDDEPQQIEYTSAFELGRSTLLADFTPSGDLVQVTERGFCVSGSLHANFEDTTKHEFDSGDVIVAAALILEPALLVVAVCQRGSYNVFGYKLPSADPNGSLQRVFAIDLADRPLALDAVTFEDTVVVAVSTAGSEVVLISWQPSTSDPSTTLKSFPDAISAVLCDSLVMLQADTGDGSRPTLVVVCGMRDGTLVAFHLTNITLPGLDEGMSISVGVSSVKLVRMLSDADRAIAMCGNSTYSLALSNNDPDRLLSVEYIWATDRHQPEYAPGEIGACAQLPTASLLSSSMVAESLVMVAGDDLLVGRLEPNPSAVPRQIPVSGSPYRLVHAEDIKSYACASIVSDVRVLPSSVPHSPPQEKRQIWPVIDFVSRKGSQVSYSHHMQPGERVGALLQWTHRQGSEKSYSFLLVGGSYIRHKGTRRGCVTFLQCSLKHGMVVDAREGKRHFFEEHVDCLALYDDATYIACAGERVYMYRHFADESEWRQICVPYRLASHATHMTVEVDGSAGRLIVISTAADSLVVLRLEETASESVRSANATLSPVAMGPKAARLLNHLILPATSTTSLQVKSERLALMTTKHGQLLGMSIPKKNESQAMPYSTGEIIFEATLPQSLARLVRSPPSPRKGSPPEGALGSERIRGIAIDGSLVSIALLRNDEIWKKLFWLQRLIEWSPDLSPHSFPEPTYEIQNVPHGLGTRNRTFRVSFHASQDAVLHTTNTKLDDLHVDGDVLARILGRGGREAVERVLQSLAQREDSLGAWMRAHWEEEMFGLEEVVGVVRRLHRWL